MPPAEQMNKQILVVEDEGLIAADVQRRLQRLGYSVPAIAQSGKEALRCTRSMPFDLVLMDIRIKGEMDGIETAAALKAEFETPVVYLTAHSDEATVDRAKLTEPFGYLLKPIGDGNLRSAVQIAIYKSEMEGRISDNWLSATLHSVREGLITTKTNGELTSGSSAGPHGRQSMDAPGLFEESEESRSSTLPAPLLESLSMLKHSMAALEKATAAIAAPRVQTATCSRKPRAAGARKGR